MNMLCLVPCADNVIRRPLIDRVRKRIGRVNCDPSTSNNPLIINLKGTKFNK